MLTSASSGYLHFVFYASYFAFCICISYFEFCICISYFLFSGSQRFEEQQQSGNHDWTTRRYRSHRLGRHGTGNVYYKLQCAPLNGIMDNNINQSMESNLSQLTSPKIPFHTLWRLSKEWPLAPNSLNLLASGHSLRLRLINKLLSIAYCYQFLSVPKWSH